MASFVLRCPHCAKDIEAEDEWAGQTGVCPECGRSIDIRRPVGTPPPRSPPPRQPARGWPATIAGGREAEAPVPPPAAACSLATASLVLGILTWVSCVPFLALPAIICGHLARGRIRAARGALTGDGAALAGLVLGYVNVVLVALALAGMLAAIAVPAVVKSRAAGTQQTCLANLRVLESAKEMAVLEQKLGPGEPVMPEAVLPYLKDNQLPRCPQGGTYTLGTPEEPPRCSVTGHGLP